MKRLLSIFVILALENGSSLPCKGQTNNKVDKVVIDAGHGGPDAGALGKHSREKDITLDIALKLGSLIRKNMPEVQVIFTRTDDTFIELYRRAKIANENKADLFISIHCNSSRSSRPSGTETWVMGLQKSEANLEVAKKENSSILLENDYSQQYDGFDPNSPEAYILFSMFQNAYLEQSLNLASKIQGEFHRTLGLEDRGVKQAGFLVLYKTAMPGLLVETGFINNVKEEQYLMSEEGQNALAESIFKAFRAYKEEADHDKIRKTPVLVSNGDSAAGTGPLQEKAPGESGHLHGFDPVKPDTEIPATQAVRPKEPVKQKPTIGDPPRIDVVFRVQVATFTKRKSLKSPDFRKLKKVYEYQSEGKWRYAAGNETHYQGALDFQAKLAKMGYKNTLVVAFQNGKKIPLSKAIELTKK